MDSKREGIEDYSKYRLIINLIDFLDNKLDSDISDESRELLLEIQKIALNELKYKL